MNVTILCDILIWFCSKESEIQRFPFQSLSLEGCQVDIINCTVHTLWIVWWWWMLVLIFPENSHHFSEQKSNLKMSKFFFSFLLWEHHLQFYNEASVRFIIFQYIDFLLPKDFTLKFEPKLTHRKGCIFPSPQKPRIDGKRRKSHENVVIHLRVRKKHWCSTANNKKKIKI